MSITVVAAWLVNDRLKSSTNKSSEKPNTAHSNPPNPLGSQIHVDDGIGWVQGTEDGSIWDTGKNQ